MSKFSDFAKKIHKNDNWGTLPYTEHLRRIVALVPKKAHAVAWLHDSLESHSSCQDQLKKLVDPKTYQAIEMLTRKPGETYMEYIQRIEDSQNNKIAKMVKIADLKVNLANLPAPTLAKRYHKALNILEAEHD